MKANTQKEYGFTIIELMVTVAVIAILCAIAIPNYLGFKERAKRQVIKEIASSAKGELHHWISATLHQEKGVIDVNGDGRIDPDEVHTNMLTIPNSWVQAFAKKIGRTPSSPWNGSKPLFTIGQINPPSHGQIVLSIINKGRGIRIVSYDNNGVSQSDSVSVE